MSWLQKKLRYVIRKVARKMCTAYNRKMSRMRRRRMNMMLRRERTPKDEEREVVHLPRTCTCVGLHMLLVSLVAPQRHRRQTD